MEPGLAGGDTLPPPCLPNENGDCDGGGPPAPCVLDADCDFRIDENDTCNAASCDAGDCVITNTCTGSFGCAVDICFGPAGCLLVDRDSLCDDGNPCTPDTCDDGVCYNGDALCDDGNFCTVDQCGSDGCVNTPNDALCDDEVACTLDACGGGGCLNTPSNALCDDNNECTDDTCSTSGCSNLNTPKSAPCDDGLLCTQADICVDGICSGTPRVCNTGDFCTSVDCNPLNGCQDPPGPTCVPPTPVCIDNENDQRCVECEFDTDCTADPLRQFCDDIAGVCFECLDGSFCPDLLPVCDATGTCVECVSASDCDDQNPCTQQECHAADNECHTIPIPGCCQADGECDDVDTCTDDSCCIDPAGCCTDPNTCVNTNECIFNPDSDGDGVGNCDDDCLDGPDAAGCPANFGCACAQGDLSCCDSSNPLCCDPNDPEPLCQCDP